MQLFAVDSAGRVSRPAALAGRYFELRSLTITQSGNVMVDMLGQEPGDSFSAATIPQVREYSLVNGSLVRIDAPAPAKTGTAGLVGTSARGNAGLDAMLLAVVVGAAFAARALGARKLGGRAR